MERKIRKYLEDLVKKNRKRFYLVDLENYIRDSFGGSSKYLEKGGYIAFSKAMNKLKDENLVKEIKASAYNGLNPPLRLRWEIMVKEKKQNWDKSKLLKFSDLLDFTYYLNNPNFQSDKEWEYVENIYNFLKDRDKREWASVEERSLELFYDEKYLIARKDSPKGKYGILKRLKLSYDDLKMKNYGEMFIYWNRGTRDIRKVIILENHSTFFSYKKMAEKNKEIFGIAPDILIYGEGNKIENSFAFIEEIGDISNMEVYYFGDIDSEGFGIYTRLKERYPNAYIKLQKQAYVHLISLCNRSYPWKGKVKNQVYLDFFLKEMGDFLASDLRDKLINIWEKDFRIPQELINYEYLLKVI